MSCLFGLCNYITFEFWQVKVVSVFPVDCSGLPRGALVFVFGSPQIHLRFELNLGKQPTN